MGPYQPSPKAGTHSQREIRTCLKANSARKFVHIVRIQKGHAAMLISTQVSSVPLQQTRIAFLLHWNRAAAIFRYKWRRYLLWS